MDMNETECHKSVLSTPPETPPPSLIMVSSSSNEANYSTPGSESDSDADGCTDTGSEENMMIDSENAEMEWEVLKKDIRDELAQEMAQLEKLKEIKEQEENKENNGRTLMVEPKIYDRLHHAYMLTAGQPPTNEIMIQLQDSYLAIKKTYPDNEDGNSATEITSPNPPKKSPIKKRHASVTRTLAATNYTPPISSHLSQNPPITFQPPEPPLVFLIGEATSDDNSKPAEVRPTSVVTTSNNLNMPNKKNTPPIIKAKVVPLVDDNMGEIDLLDSSKPAETPELIKTAPASPVDKEQVNRDGNHFFWT